MITLPKTNMTISIAPKDGVWGTTLNLGGPTFGAMLVLEDFLEKKGFYHISLLSITQLSLRTALEAAKSSGPVRSAQR